MIVSDTVVQHVTNASGTVAIASTSTSLGVASVINSSPEITQSLATTAQSVISTADLIGIFSVSILALSFLFNVYATKRRRILAEKQTSLDERFYTLRKAEHELDLTRYKASLTECE